MGFSITNQSEGIPVPSSLSEHTITFNNISLTFDGKAVKIETNGEWEGDLLDLSTLVEMAIEGYENDNK